MPQTYGQYCGMARGAEIFATLWTPIILRNLLLGASTFGEILDGAPGLSRTLLSQRLRMLARYGVVEQDRPSGRRPTYRLTKAGLDLSPVVESLGRWGEQWLNLAPHHLDAGVVLWTLARHVRSDLLPDARTVVRVDVADDRRGRFWLLADPAHVELCLRPPGGSDDAVIRTTCDALTRWHLGELSLPHAMRDGLISAEGARGGADVRFLGRPWLLPSGSPGTELSAMRPPSWPRRRLNAAHPDRPFGVAATV